MCWMLAKRKVLLVCTFAELSELRLQGLSPYSTLTRRKGEISQTLANTSEDLDPVKTAWSLIWGKHLAVCACHKERSFVLASVHWYPLAASYDHACYMCTWQGQGKSLVLSMLLYWPHRHLRPMLPNHGKRIADCSDVASLGWHRHSASSQPKGEVGCWITGQIIICKVCSSDVRTGQR